MKEYGGLDMFLKEKAGGEEKAKHYQLCLC